MSKTRILIVEDEVIISIQSEEKLNSLGYDVAAIINNADDVTKKHKQANWISS